MENNPAQLSSAAIQALSHSPIPVDVFLEVVPYLSIRDIFTIRQVCDTAMISVLILILAQTCKSFLAVTRLRSVWSILVHTHVLEKDIPLPGLMGRSIGALPAEELERLTLAALRLRKRWTSPAPTPTKRITLRPIRKPGAAVALHFLPGRDNRWLLSLTLVDQSSMMIQCWDLRASPLRCVARCHIVVPLSFALNTDPTARWVFAFQEPQFVRLRCGENEVSC